MLIVAGLKPVTPDPKSGALSIRPKNLRCESKTCTNIASKLCCNSLLCLGCLEITKPQPYFIKYIEVGGR